MNITYEQAFEVLKKTIIDFKRVNEETAELPETAEDPKNLAYLNGVNSCAHFILMMMEDLEKQTK